MLKLIAIIFQFRAIAIVMYLKLENAFNKKKKCRVTLEKNSENV